MSKRTKKTTRDKPTKPYPGFPLFPHATRRWAKKIRGKFHYFGPWSDPDGALERYLDQRDDLHAGRTPRVQTDQPSMRDLLNRFLTAKQRLLDAGEISPITFIDYRRSCNLLAKAFGLDRLVVDLACADFEKLRADLSKTRGPVAVGNEVTRIRSVFKYAYDAGLIDRPIQFGPLFRRPSKKVLRQERNKKGPRIFERGHLRRILNAAKKPLNAMVLLGINCGFGNQDCGKLPITALDLENGWVDYPRPKTGVSRRCPLWPETVSALGEVLAARTKLGYESISDLVFITKYGRSWAKTIQDNPVSKETAKLLKKLGIHRPGLNFYALRHTFATVAGETRDQVAVDHIMGHSRNDMPSQYRHHISDERLKAVTDFVREWLFGQSDAGAGDASTNSDSESAKDHTDAVEVPADAAAAPQTT